MLVSLSANTVAACVLLCQLPFQLQASCSLSCLVTFVVGEVADTALLVPFATAFEFSSPLTLCIGNPFHQIPSFTVGRLSGILWFLELFSFSWLHVAKNVMKLRLQRAAADGIQESPAI